MKKIVSLLLCLAVVLSLCSCTVGNKATTTEPNNTYATVTREFVPSSGIIGENEYKFTGCEKFTADGYDYYRVYIDITVNSDNIRSVDVLFEGNIDSQRLSNGVGLSDALDKGEYIFFGEMFINDGVESVKGETYHCAKDIYNENGVEGNTLNVKLYNMGNQSEMVEHSFNLDYLPGRP